jgi:MacB-like periplasmic core domain
MNWLKEIKRRILFAFRREQFDRDLTDEIQFHLEMKAERNRKLGLNETDARADARRRFGNRTLLKEESREVWVWTGVEQLLQDIKQALRSMHKAKSFAVASLLTFALAIGVNAAIFSLVQAVLLSPLPYKDSDRLMIGTASVPDFEDLRHSVRAFDECGIWATNQYTARLGGEAEQITSALVSSQVLPMLSAPEVGRTFSEREAEQPLVVISHKLWNSRYGADPKVLGRTLTLNDRTFTIVGIMPRDLSFRMRSLMSGRHSSMD